MQVTQRTCLAAGILIIGFGLARPSLAITGGANAYFNGTYNAQITNIAFANGINAINAIGTTGATGATGITGTTAALPSGLGGNAASIHGNVPGLGRFYFDRNETIMGVATTSTINVPIYTPVGVYTVASNCAAALTLTSGQHYNAVIADQGNQVLFVQSNVKGNGAGDLQRSVNSCTASQYPQSFWLRVLWRHSDHLDWNDGRDGKQGLRQPRAPLTPRKRRGPRARQDRPAQPALRARRARRPKPSCLSRQSAF
jgi:hypothetical protein